MEVCNRATDPGRSGANDYSVESPVPSRWHSLTSPVIAHGHHQGLDAGMPPLCDGPYMKRAWQHAVTKSVDVLTSAWKPRRWSNPVRTRLKQSRFMGTERREESVQPPIALIVAPAARIA